MSQPHTAHTPQEYGHGPAHAVTTAMLRVRRHFANMAKQATAQKHLR